MMVRRWSNLKETLCLSGFWWYLITFQFSPFWAPPSIWKATFVIRPPPPRNGARVTAEWLNLYEDSEQHYQANLWAANQSKVGLRRPAHERSVAVFFISPTWYLRSHFETVQTESAVSWPIPAVVNIVGSRRQPMSVLLTAHPRQQPTTALLLESVFRAAESAWVTARARRCHLDCGQYFTVVEYETSYLG